MTKYNYGDEVSFYFCGKQYTGTIKIIDKYGIFFDNSQPYYDIMVNNILIKHIPQDQIKEVKDMKEVAIIFYEKESGLDCDIWEAFSTVEKAETWLNNREWIFHERNNCWSHSKYDGKAYIVVREVY